MVDVARGADDHDATAQAMRERHAHSCARSTCSAAPRASGLAQSIFRLPISNMRAELRKLGQKRCLIIEAAQIQDQGSVLDVAEHWDWQLAQRQDQRLETAAGALADRWRDGNAGAGKRLERQCAGANLACAGSDVYTVSLAQRQSHGLAQPRRSRSDLGVGTREVA